MVYLLCSFGHRVGVILVVYLLCSYGCRATFTSANLTYTNARNNLTRIPIDIPPEAVNIYLHDNQIVTIQDDVFMNNVNCVKMRLDHNNLVTIKRSMWTGLVSLKWLDLSRNHIKHIEPLAFTELTELKGVYLSYNQLTTLREDIFALDYHPDLVTLHSNTLPQDDLRLCWIQDGKEEGWISGFTLDASTAFQCDKEGMHNKTGNACCLTTGRSQIKSFACTFNFCFFPTPSVGSSSKK